MNFTVTRSGEEIGQYSEADIQDKLNSGILLPTDFAWREGMVEPVPIVQLFSVTRVYANSDHLPQDLVTGPTNSLGLVGFILSLFGLASCGLLSLVSLILCSIALKKEPKGFAITGMILSILSLLAMIVILILWITPVALLGFGVRASMPYGETSMELRKIAEEIVDIQHSTGSFPSSSQGPKIVNGRVDGWGNVMEYRGLVDDEVGYDLRSAGKDGVFDTVDDMIWEGFGVVDDPFDENSTEN